MDIVDSTSVRIIVTELILRDLGSDFYTHLNEPTIILLRDEMANGVLLWPGI